MAPCTDVYHLRRARHDDARGIAHVHVETWRHAYRDLIPDEYLDALSVEQREGWWAKELDLLPPERQPWVAETRNGIVGFAIGGGARDEDAGIGVGEVYAIYVLPDCWERGLGRTLLDHAEHDLIAHGYSEAVLWVLADNARARRFYELLGWHPDGAKKTGTFAGRELEEVRYRVALEKSRIAELV